ncbi:putative dynein heavy chain [Trypanosoma grayi]|uniref:putative dynein heavy chain n=1 Tax=Trypanosoma grayi TaxID=71804 RepID=UPI0004F49D88|nr:putative dynein heavy chain [Trypanosoma grayi]KEG13264.1 putative dynein heavy chain [Trypanosoma grayi]
MATAQQHNEEASHGFWWTHQRLAEEAASALATPTAESTILSCMDEVKVIARELLKVAMPSRSGKKESLPLIDSAGLQGWHEKLICVRDRLLVALVAVQQEQHDGVAEVATSGGGPVCERARMELRHTVHHMLFRVVLGEWAAQWASSSEGASSESVERLVDGFLDDIAFTYASRWDADDAVAMRNIVSSFVVETLGMMPIEEERLLPRLAQHSWDAFLLELQGVEDEVQRVCGAVEKGEMVGERKSTAQDLAARVICVLKMLAVLPPTEAVATEVMMGTSTKYGHVVLTTSAKARAVVESLGRWLPVCVDFFYTMVPRRHGEKKTEDGGVDANEEGDGAAAAAATTPEARNWIRRLQQEVQRLFFVLGQFDETSPWIVVLAGITARTFFMTHDSVAQQHEDNSNDTKNNDDDGMQMHAALKAFLAWQMEAVESAPASQRALADACNMKMGHVVSCALDKSGPSSLSIRVLRVLLVQRPLTTLRHFLGFLCPTNSVAAACDCEAAITDKGSSSESRSLAFRDEPLEENAAALMFFPKYFTVFCTVEQALSSLCGDLAGGDVAAAAHVVESFAAAALDDAFTGLSGSGGAAASEWLMFLAFVCSETPLFDVAALHHVRNAARRFFAPGRAMLSYLRRRIVLHGQHGLAAFFLPPLRAVGVDYSTAADREHVSCALRYPQSAEVAYFQELPRGFYSRQPMRLAVNAKNDALRFFHDFLMPPSSSSSAAAAVPGEGTTREDESVVLRNLFVDIVAHVGVLAAARVRGEAGCNSAADAVTMDVMLSVFFGVLRLCSSVTYWEAAKRHDIQRAIVQRMCELSATPAYAVARGGGKTHRLAATAGGKGERKSPLPMAFLLRGGCALEKATADAATAGMPTAAVPAAAVEVGGGGGGERGGAEMPHAWHDWFCATEFEDLDARAGSCAMVLLRACNRQYVKDIPTRTLLARRSTLEQHAAKEKDSGAQARALAAMEAAIQHDVNLLSSQQSNKEIVQQQQQQQQQMKKTVAVDEEVKAEADMETNRTGIDASAAAVTTARGETAKLTGDVNANKDKNSDGGAENEEQQKQQHQQQKQSAPPPRRDDRPLPLTVVKPYIEKMALTLMQRARMSVVDGTVSGMALKKWLMVIAGQFEPPAVLEAVRRVVLQANTKLTHATKLECASLSAFLGVVADDIALPYKMSFIHARSTHTKTQQQQQQQQHGSVRAEVEADKSEWPRHALPSSEKNADMLLRVLIADTTRTVTSFLEEGTPLGDWKAYSLGLHLRRIMGLVQRHEAAFRAALAKRLQQLGMTPGSANSTHPVQMLSAVEFPLLENMTAPAGDVDHLFSNAPPSAVASRHPPAFSRTTGGRGNNKSSSGSGNTNTGVAADKLAPGAESSAKNNNNNGRREWVASGDALRRKRHRPSDDSYTHRHGKWRSGPRDNAE